MSESTSPKKSLKSQCRLGPGTFVCSLFLLITVLLFTSDRGQIAGDGIPRWEALHLLMSRGELSSDKYSLIQPLAALPLYVAVDTLAGIAGLTGEDRVHTVHHAVKRFNKLIALLILIWIYWLLRSKADFTCRGAGLSVLFLLFGSILIPHSKDFYSEPLWTLLALLVITSLVQLNDRSLHQANWRHSVTTLVMVSLLIPLNPLLLLVFGFFGLFIAIKRLSAKKFRLRRGLLARIMKADLWIIGIGMIMGVLLSLAENYARRGAFLDFGYPGEGFSTPFFTGLAGQVISPTRGLLWYLPTFLCGLALLTKYKSALNPFTGRFVSLSFIYGCLLLLAYSTWHAWHGAWYWGPRFLLPLAISGGLYFALIAKPLWNGSIFEKAVFVLLLVYSYMVYKVGVGVGQAPLIACLEITPEQEPCYWKWTFSPFASWINPGDLMQMLSHRSTAVDAFGALSGFLLLRKAPANLDRGGDEL